MNEQEKLRNILYYSDMHPNDCQFIQDLIDNKDKEIERLNNIIKDINKLLKDDDFSHIEKLQEIHKLVGSDK